LKDHQHTDRHFLLLTAVKPVCNREH